MCLLWTDWLYEVRDDGGSAVASDIHMCVCVVWFLAEEEEEEEDDDDNDEEVVSHTLEGGNSDVWENLREIFQDIDAQDGGWVSPFLSPSPSKIIIRLSLSVGQSVRLLT